MVAIIHRILKFFHPLYIFPKNDPFLKPLKSVPGMNDTPLFELVGWLPVNQPSNFDNLLLFRYHPR